ncbi:MAG: glutamate 5-kinase [Candidatus Omnitrophota bacterium]
MKKVVVKAGSSVIAPNGKLDSLLIGRIVKSIVKAHDLGYKIALVSSGAIACGLNKINLKKRPQDTHSLMALSSLGQIALMDMYEAKFKRHSRHCAQVLLTWDDFDSRRRFMNAKHTINKLFAMGITPIINENDAVSFDEIRFGDNDKLSALVGDLIGAERLIMLSNVSGLMDGGNLVRFVECVDAKMFSLVRKKKSMFTAGGMEAKLQAAKTAALSGIRTVIANGREKSVIERLLKGEKIGTEFKPLKDITKARKRWIAFSKKVKGAIYIDNGAKEAIANKGKSLLSVGIEKTEGDFKKGDSVEILDYQGASIGCGIVNYSCQELKDCRHKKLDREVIHRDDLVLGDKK